MDALFILISWHNRRTELLWSIRGKVFDCMGSVKMLLKPTSWRSLQLNQSLERCNGIWANHWKLTLLARAPISASTTINERPVWSSRPHWNSAFSRDFCRAAKVWLESLSSRVKFDFSSRLSFADVFNEIFPFFVFLFNARSFFLKSCGLSSFSFCSFSSLTS